MAKDNNLTDFLTDVADAIREKEESSALINPQEFAAKIRALQTGGGGVAVANSDVNFRDYDGTILHSYTKTHFLDLTELPKLPARPGLICQGWNYSLADAQSHVSELGVLDVGATYITDDGKTRLYIRIANKGRMAVPLYFSQTVAEGVAIDWGDGSGTQTLSGTGNVNTTHTYADKGEYVISLDVADSCTLRLGTNSSSNCVLGPTTNTNLYNDVYRNMLQKVEIGKNVTAVGDSAFYECYSLASISLPETIAGSISISAFKYCSSLSFIVLPKDVTGIGGEAFYSCNALKSLSIPMAVKSIGNYVFKECDSLASIVIPNEVNSISNNVFYACSSLASVVVPKSLTTISDGLFYQCYGMAIYDFRAFTDVPTLSSSSAFNGIPDDCKIIVPDGLYERWRLKTNWAYFESCLVKQSEYKD